MTTTVTVKTHDWPAAVAASSNHSHFSERQTSYGHSRTETFVAANSEQTFSVSDTTEIFVRELPKDATGLGTGNATLAGSFRGSTRFAHEGPASE